MQQETTRARWLNVINIILLVLLTGTIILLIRENAELRSIIDKPSEVGNDRLIEVGDFVSGFSYQLPTSDAQVYRLDRWTTNTLVFLFSTSCPFCEQIVPKWTIIDKALDRNDIQVLGVSIDSPDLTASYLLKHEISFDVISTFVDTNFQVRNHLTGVPITLLVDTLGGVHKVWPGLLSDDQFTEIFTVLSDTTALGTATQQ